MTPMAHFARRVGMLPEALAILEMHPEGLPLAQLAADVGESHTSLREALLAYYRADVVDMADFRLPVIEFVGAEGEDDDPATAEVVRAVAAAPERELGVQHLTAEQLGALYQSGLDLLSLEPENAVLAEALRAFRDGLWSAGDGSTEEGRGAEQGRETGREKAQQINDAARRHRRVRMVYARAWAPGTSERTIEPYRAIRTRRGWEVDAGPLDADGHMRTFLVSGIREMDVLEETFEPPTDVDELIAAHRQPTEVELVVPQAGRWAVERFAESVTVVDDDEEAVHLWAAMLPPVAERVGLALITCGPSAFVVRPSMLLGAGAAAAQQLLDHHANGP